MINRLLACGRAMTAVTVLVLVFAAPDKWF